MRGFLNKLVGAVLLGVGIYVIAYVASGKYTEAWVGILGGVLVAASYTWLWDHKVDKSTKEGK